VGKGALIATQIKVDELQKKPYADSCNYNIVMVPLTIVE